MPKNKFETHPIEYDGKVFKSKTKLHQYLQKKYGYDNTIGLFYFLRKLSDGLSIKEAIIRKTKKVEKKQRKDTSLNNVPEDVIQRNIKRIVKREKQKLKSMQFENLEDVFKELE